MTITLRNVKGSALTHVELDGNFTDLDTNKANITYVDTQVTNLLDGAPGALDTLNELAAALNDDPAFFTTVTTSIAGKEPAISVGTTAQYWRGDKSFQTLNTGVIPESGNLYYTAARDTAQFTTDLATKTTANLTEGANLYYTAARDTAQFTTDFATKTTANLTEGANLYYTDARADARAQLKIDALVDSAPGTLDTLNELAAAIADDANYAGTITTALAGKEPTVTAGTTAQYRRGDKSWQTLDSSVVPENTNLYYTDARADARADVRIAASSIHALSDVNISPAPSTGQGLTWDGSQFIPADVVVPGATITAPTAGTTILTTSATASTEIPSFNRTLTTDDVGSVMTLLAEKVTNMGDGFGAGLAILAKDTSGVNNYLGGIYAERDGGDTRGALVFYTNNAGSITEKVKIYPEGNVQFNGAFTFPIADGTVGQHLSTDGAGAVNWESGKQGPFRIFSTAFNAEAGENYAIDTTASAITATLPASPVQGDAVFFADAGGVYATNNLTVARNGNTIMGAAADKVVSTNDESFGLFWSGIDWRTY